MSGLVKYGRQGCACSDNPAYRDREVLTGPGYHLRDIPKGVLGSSSKIREELEELIDAENQGIRVMQLIELSDLVGAVELYLEKNFQGVSLGDLQKMAAVTRRAFESGRR